MSRLLVFLLLFSSNSAWSYALYTSPENPKVPLKWFTNQAGLTFDANAPEEIQLDDSISTIMTSFNQWAALQCAGSLTPYTFSNAGITNGKTVGYIEDSENENLVIWVSSSQQWRHHSSVLALTSLTYNPQTGEIVDADLEINDSRFNYSLDANATQVDLKNTIVHEAGHFLGLDHSQSVSATMFERAPIGEKKKRTLEDDDRQGFCALYGANAIGVVEQGSENAQTSTVGCNSVQYAPLTEHILILVVVLLCLISTKNMRRVDTKVPKRLRQRS